MSHLFNAAVWDYFTTAGALAGRHNASNGLRSGEREHWFPVLLADGDGGGIMTGLFSVTWESCGGCSSTADFTAFRL